MMKNLLNLVGIALLFCVSTSMNAQNTAGLFTFTFNQPTPTSPAVSGGSNVLAVWIENGAGTFIKTRYRFASNSTKDHLPTWAAKSGGTLTNCMATTCNVTSATTGATRKATAVATTPTSATPILNFGSKTVTWDGTNAAGTIVADGVYKVWVESSWNDGPNNIHNEIISFTFNKGVAAEHLTPAGDTKINSVITDWAPALATDTFSTNPEAVIYPNPTNGVFTIDFKNEVNNIKVINMLGAVILDEKVDLNAGTSKNFDLSNFSNGMYIVNVSNNTGASTNYKVVVNK